MKNCVLILLAALFAGNVFADRYDWFSFGGCEDHAAWGSYIAWNSQTGQYEYDFYKLVLSDGIWKIPNDAGEYIIARYGMDIYNAIETAMLAYNGVLTLAENIDNLQIDFSPNGDTITGTVTPSPKAGTKTATKNTFTFPKYTIAKGMNSVVLKKDDTRDSEVTLPAYAVEHNNNYHWLKRDTEYISAWPIQTVEQYGDTFTFKSAGQSVATWTQGGGGGSVSVDDITIGRDGAQKLTIKDFGANNCNETMAGMLESGDTSHKILAAKKDGETNVLHYVSMGHLSTNNCLRTFTFKNQNGVYGTLSRGDCGENDPIIGITDVGLVDFGRKTGGTGDKYFLTHVANGKLESSALSAQDIADILEGKEINLDVNVPYADEANEAATAQYADSAIVAGEANYAEVAGSATNANYATSAGTSTYSYYASGLATLTSSGTVDHVSAIAHGNGVTIVNELTVLSEMGDGDDEATPKIKVGSGGSEGYVTITPESVDINGMTFKGGDNPAIRMAGEGERSLLVSATYGIVATNTGVAVAGYDAKFTVNGTNVVTLAADSAVGALRGSFLELTSPYNNTNWIMWTPDYSAHGEGLTIHAPVGISGNLWADDVFFDSVNVRDIWSRSVTISPEGIAATNTIFSVDGTNIFEIVDTKIAAASYALTNALVSLNKSVQYVTASGEITIQAPTADGDNCRDWVVYVNATAAAQLNLTQLPHVYVADAAYTNECAAGKVTALYITEMTSGTFAIGRQELEAVK